MSRPSEIAAIEEAHRAAQARLGISGAYLALGLWSGVSPTNPVATGGAWLARALRMILAIRRKSLRLSRTYYQLVRALDTGRTLGQLESGEVVSLPALRKQYLDLLTEIADLGKKPGTGEGEDKWLGDELYNADPEGDNVSAKGVRFSDTDLTSYLADLVKASGVDNPEIVVDRFTWPIDASEASLKAAFEKMLTEEALEAQAKKAAVHRANADLTADEALARMEADHERSGSRGAGVVDWAGLQAGRSLISYAGRQDRQVRAVARGTSSNPCAWCAMLASRGFAYVSAGAAGFNGERVTKWHTNCHCFPIVRWVDNPELPAQSQFFKSKWPDVTEGYSGKDALNAWRRWLSKEYRSAAKQRAAATQQ